MRPALLSERWRFVLAFSSEAAALLLVVAAYRARWSSLESLVAAVDHCELFFCDFIRHFYPAGRAVLSSAGPSGGFYYPPFAALLFAALSALPLASAGLAWLVLQLAAVAVLLVVPARLLLGPRPGWAVRFGSAWVLAASLPVIHCLKWGQVSLVLTALAIAALWQLEAGRKTLAAGLLAAAISIKLYPAVVLFYPLVRKDWRFLGLCAGFTAALSVLLPAAVMGPGEAWGFFVAVQASAEQALGTWVRQDVNSQYLGHVLGRWLGDGALGASWIWLALGVAIAAANLGLLGKALVAKVDNPVLWVWTLCLGSLPFVLKTSWPHYFVFLPAIQAGLFVAARQAQRVRAPAMALLALSVVGSSAATLLVVGRWEAVSGWGLLFLANLAALVATWLVLADRLLELRPALAQKK
ncbi:MAG TPA: glycosyltransferase family 87 protein [Myxococcales bacterium]